jgi:GrpB-like predicted nucleotidyltransferase (UPF0157 family)
VIKPLRTETPATDPIRVVAYDAQCPTLFLRQSGTLRAALGEVALRIDHIGSTAVPGLAAKPIIDIQISVAAFEPLDAFRAPLERLGARHLGDSESPGPMRRASQRHGGLIRRAVRRGRSMLIAAAHTAIAASAASAIRAGLTIGTNRLRPSFSSM